MSSLTAGVGSPTVIRNTDLLSNSTFMKTVDEARIILADLKAGFDIFMLDNDVDEVIFPF